MLTLPFRYILCYYLAKKDLNVSFARHEHSTHILQCHILRRHIPHGFELCAIDAHVLDDPRISHPAHIICVICLPHVGFVCLANNILYIFVNASLRRTRI